MSDDEACRRIDLARLARRFPALFPMLAAGEISLSVALLLKHVLSEGNQVELLAALRGASIRQAREAIAARFPQPDVPSVIRKLPERRGAPGMAAAAQGASRTALRHEVGAPVLPVAVARASAAHPMPPEPSRLFEHRGNDSPDSGIGDASFAARVRRTWCHAASNCNST